MIRLGFTNEITDRKPTLKSHLEQQPISPFVVYDKYTLKCLKGKEYIKRSKTIQKSYGLADPALRSQLLKDFLKVKDAQDALAWVQQYGFLAEHEEWNGPSEVPTSVLTFPVKTFLQASASAKWIMKFACSLQEKETNYDDSFWSWIQIRNDLGDCQRAIFEPKPNEIPHFEYVVDKIVIVNDWHCTNLDEESLCVMSKDKLFDYPLTEEFWEDVRRWKSGSDFNKNQITNQATRSNFKWLINDDQLLDLAKEYVKNLFDQLLTDVCPTFELRSTTGGALAVLPAPKLESPWKAINFGLYEYLAGFSPLKKCRNPRCNEIDDGWPMQKKYCSEKCQKFCERNGQKLRSKSRKMR